MTVLVAVAFVLALPLMWYSMDTWLSRFAYRIPIDSTMLVLPGVVAVALAWLTVGYQSWQASRQAPVELMSGAD